MSTETRLDLLLERWEVARRRGGTPAIEELCADCPELIEALRSRIAVMEDLDAWLASTVEVKEDPSPPAAPRLQPAIAEYRGLSFLARGGLGEVFLARDETLGREVAVKLIQAPRAAGIHRRRFLREAEVTGRLEHPGVIPVYGCGLDADGRPYYVMRRIKGQTLQQAISGFHEAGAGDRDDGARRLALRKLLQQFVSVCDTIAYAHSRGVIHRDLKPGNIMIGPFGETLVIDWGLARIDGAADLPESDTEGVGIPYPTGPDELTGTGQALGTPGFMSPEQTAARWEDVGPASDIYGLGATLYCLLTGRPPFDEPHRGRLLENVACGEFPLPRMLNPEVPRPLEAICLKAMALDPRARYSTARALADDVERWMADEPVSAWREPGTVRLRRWLARRKTTVASMMAALLVAAIATTYLAYEARLRDIRRLAQANGRVDTLMSAEIGEVPRILDLLQDDRQLVRSRLRDLIRPGTDGPRSAHHRLHAALALLPDDPTQAEFLAGRVVRGETSVEELLVVRRVLRDCGHADAWIPRLWASLANHPDELTRPQLCAAGALAVFAPDDARWRDLASPVAAALVKENPALIAAWRVTFEPVADQLAPPLRRSYGDRGRPEERALAFTLLFDFAVRRADPDKSEALAVLVVDADPDQFRRILGALTDRRRAVVVLEDRLDRHDQPGGVTGRGRGRVAAALVVLGQPGRSWPLLRSGDDPDARTELMHVLQRFGADVRDVLGRLAVERDVRARRALVLALSEYADSQIPDDQRCAIEAEFLRDYRLEPDPGLRSAIDWLLRRRWGRAVELDRIDMELAGKGPGPGRDWYVNSQGQTLVIIRGPTEFRMGSSDSEPGRRPNGEPVHTRSIPRTFAIAAREVTRAQYERFLDETPQGVVRRPETIANYKDYMPEPDCPAVGMNWYEAARYCNWLSERDGIPEAEWCYRESLSPDRPMELRPNHLDRIGYRLPTEVEWECACRAGTGTSRPHGESAEMLVHFAWYLENARNRTHPVGSLKPNDLGLFDVLGNAIEWTNTRFVPDFRPIPGGAAIPDLEEDGPIPARVDMMLRGGSFYYYAPFIRSANRNWNSPNLREETFGFRPARTVEAR
jgi:formylglycine-generating enzyme required for sulfatase activity/serine/threonine protein kinase